jgi:carboxylesterase type B
MRRLVITLLAAALFSGCAATRKGDGGGFMERRSGSVKLAQAEEMLAGGDSAGAARTLGIICFGPDLPGVTDEALFRLALLSLKHGAEKPSYEQGHQLLKRLKKEYPASPWTLQASQLSELLNADDELRHQNKSLKAANLTLAGELKELNKNIEQLKQLDFELERTNR